MPRVGLTMEEGTIVQWLKAEGEVFVEDEVIAEMTSDKSTSEVTAPFAGKLIKILIANDETCPVGEPIARVEKT